MYEAITDQCVSHTHLNKAFLMVLAIDLCKIFIAPMSAISPPIASEAMRMSVRSSLSCFICARSSYFRRNETIANSDSSSRDACDDNSHKHFATGASWQPKAGETSILHGLRRAVDVITLSAIIRREVNQTLVKRRGFTRQACWFVHDCHWFRQAFTTVLMWLLIVRT